MSCPLCERGKVSHWYLEDDICWVADCITFGLPMIVLKRHTMDPTDQELNHLKSVVNNLFPSKGLRKGQRRRADHLHWHIV